MSTLDTAVRTARQWNEAQGRKELKAMLAAILHAYEEVVQIWQQYLDTHPSTPISGSRWSIVNWIGRDRADQLWALNRKINKLYERVAELTGAPLDWAFPRDEVMLDLADRQLIHYRETTGTRAAQVAITHIELRLEHIRELLQELG